MFWGLKATPKNAGKVAAGTGEGPSRYDGLLARAWSVIGLEPGQVWSSSPAIFAVEDAELCREHSNKIRCL